MGGSVDLVVGRQECFCIRQFIFSLECEVGSSDDSWRVHIGGV